MTDDAFAPLPGGSMRPDVEHEPANTVAPVVPVPADAPPLDVLFKGRGPDLTWRYATADGGLIGYACRWNTADGKEIRFALYGMKGGGPPRWHLKQHPVPRPLYGLDRLAARPDAPVVVVEGEKAADAAAKVFLKSVVVTSPAGANAAGKADWSPLRGRTVLIWPDNDTPGAAYAEAVAGLLHGVAREVLILDPAALADRLGLSPLPDGWDAADAVEDCKPADIRAAAKASRRPWVRPPDYLSWGWYEMTAAGLHARKDDKPVFIAAPFEILGRSRDPDGNGWGRYLRWSDPDGRVKERFVSDSALQGDPGPLAAGLADAGLRIERPKQREFAAYLSGGEPAGRVTVVPRTGWHTIGGHEVFVLPAGGIGPAAAGTVILEPSVRGPYEARGSLEDWQQGLAALAADHALLVLAMSAALAGPLLHLAGMEGGGVHFYGPSSKGKTTLLQIAASIWGRGGTPGYLRSWRATANGLEGVAASATDTALILDELGQVEPRDAAAAFYLLSNGTGKARAGRNGGLREPKTWRCMILSSGEIRAADKLAEDKTKRARAGQLVRMLDLPADRGLGFGVFDHAGPDNDAAKLAGSFKEAATDAYGTAGPEYVRLLLAEGVTGEVIRGLVADFLAANVPAGADGQVQRAAQRFGVIAAAGALAAGLRLVPWPDDAAGKAAAWGFATWLDGRGGTAPAEERQAIEQVRYFIEQHGNSRFENLDKGPDEQRSVINRAGYRRGSGTDLEYLIPSDPWKLDLCNGLEPVAVARALSKAGYLDKPLNGFQHVRKIHGQNKKVYVLRASILDGGADAS